jgi:hypothetical protein
MYNIVRQYDKQLPSPLATGQYTRSQWESMRDPQRLFHTARVNNDATAVNETENDNVIVESDEKARNTMVREDAMDHARQFNGAPRRIHNAAFARIHTDMGRRAAAFREWQMLHPGSGQHYASGDDDDDDDDDDALRQTLSRYTPRIANLHFDAVTNTPAQYMPYYGIDQPTTRAWLKLRTAYDTLHALTRSFMGLTQDLTSCVTEGIAPSNLTNVDERLYLALVQRIQEILNRSVLHLRQEVNDALTWERRFELQQQERVVMLAQPLADDDNRYETSVETLNRMAKDVYVMMMCLFLAIDVVIPTVRRCGRTRFLPMELAYIMSGWNNLDVVADAVALMDAHTRMLLNEPADDEDDPEDH